MNIHFAAAWLKAFTTSPEDVLAFYADDFELSNPPQGVYIRADKTALARAVQALSNRDPHNGLGLHRLEALEYIGDHRSGLVLWRWTVRHADSVFGMRAHRQLVRTTGMSFHLYLDGKITREIVYSDQIHVAGQLGLPVATRHRGIDPSFPPTSPGAGSLRH